MVPYAWTPWLLLLWFVIGAVVALLAGLVASPIFGIPIAGGAVLVDAAAGGVWWAAAVGLAIPGAPVSTLGGVLVFVIAHHAARRARRAEAPPLDRNVDAH
jgi:hypothetical protein